jgi:hypothetical protein
MPHRLRASDARERRALLVDGLQERKFWAANFAGDVQQLDALERDIAARVAAAVVEEQQ